MKNTVTPPRNTAQPGLCSTLKIYGSKKLSTVHVQLKDSDDDRVLIVTTQDFDPDRFVRLD